VQTNNRATGLAVRLRGRGAAPPSSQRAQPAGFQHVRVSLDDASDALPAGACLAWPAPAHGQAARPYRVLALSGGGAGGAFGAGALVGLSRAGRRPEFDLVTGVSTGALIAPFAFLGSAWDAQLTDAYTGGYAAEVLALSAVRLGRGLYPGARLAQLVKRHLSDSLLAGVVAAHRDGRRLLVATANLDAQTTSIWDLGAIAAQGGAPALQLFQDVLVASASLPGVFPPKMIPVTCDGETFEEMHVDGGATSPLFIVPEPMLAQRAERWSDRGVEVYALVNTTLRPRPSSTAPGALPVLLRSFELMLRSSYRNALRSVEAFCEINALPLRTASVPAEFDGVSMLRFDRKSMARMFARGLALASEGRLWRSP